MGTLPYPRVTQVIGAMLPHEGLNRWYKRVGKEEAARISRETSTTGTLVHYRILKNLAKHVLPAPQIPLKHYSENAALLCEIAQVQWDVLNSNTFEICEGRIDVEKFCVNHDLKYCGTYDLCANISINGEEPKWTLVDLKTSVTAYENHYIQLGAYSMFIDPYPEQAMIVSVCPYKHKNPLLEGKIFHIHQPELRKHANRFLKLLEDYHQKYGHNNEENT